MSCKGLELTGGVPPAGGEGFKFGDFCIVDITFGSSAVNLRWLFRVGAHFWGMEIKESRSPAIGAGG